MDLFSVWMPFDVGDLPDDADALLAKARGEATNPNGGEATPLQGKIGGIMSTDARDQEDEEVLQSGMDFQYFLKHGWFNYEHQQGPENVLGEPTAVRPTTHKGVPATAVEGFLYLHKSRARETYETAQSMRKAASTRRLGYSVEGVKTQKDPKNPRRVLKSRVLNCAITAHPVHPDARLEVLAKASAIGYPTPSGGGGTFAPLVPQDIGGRDALTNMGIEIGLSRISMGELASRIAHVFRVPMDKARVLADQLAKTVS